MQNVSNGGGDENGSEEYMAARTNEHLGKK
jgi:hypothetical protein